MRGVFATMSLLAIAITAAPASAGKGPTYAELPVSQLGARPTTKPRAIAAKESIPGLKARLFDGTKFGGGSDKSSVLAFETTTGKPAVKASDLGGCVSAATPKGTEWDGPGDAESFTAVKKGVVPVRAEKLVEGADGTAKLEITDAWFDARSRGVRAIGKSTLALKPYATVAGGMRIFAGRDEHAGQKLVQFVVVEPRDMPASLLAVDRRRLSRVGTEAKTQILGMCSHHRIGVPTGGPGESVSFELQTILPALAPSETSNVVSDLAPMSDWETKEGARDARVRRVRIQVGVSQTSRDKDPVLSVSTEWSSPETIERIYTQRPAEFHAHHLFGSEMEEDDADPFLGRGAIF